MFLINLICYHLNIFLKKQYHLEIFLRNQTMFSSIICVTVGLAKYIGLY